MTSPDPSQSASYPASDETTHPALRDQSNFAWHLGLRTVSISAEEVVTEATVTPELINRNGVMHGGAIMALADTGGGTVAFANIAHDKTTTTVDSKTNFMRAIKAGDVVRAVSKPLHVGRTIIVVQTDLYRPDGKLAAMVVQTQMVLDAGPHKE